MTYRSECTCGCHSNPGMDPTPSSSSEPVGIDLSEFPDLPSDTRISIRIVSGEMAGTEIDNVPFSVFTPTPPSRKKPDWRDPFCKRRDENVLSNIRDAYFYGFEDALEIVSEIPTPAPIVGGIETLRAALEPFARAADNYDFDIDPLTLFGQGEDEMTVGDLRRAKAAFEAVARRE